ncbi:MAG: heavy metal-binding domain-containing protein [Rhodospirillales bacterium]|nr:heavy metal-binding domain-containing protein [Rhodospirillales bacterium]
MIVTTTDGVEGKRVVEYVGIVTGEAIMGTNVFRDMFAGIRDFVGGRSGSCEKEVKKAKDHAIDQMMEEAEELGADAIVGVDLDYEVIGGDKRTLLMAIANGTAVKLG